MDAHQEADALFGPCWRPECPGSIWAAPDALEARVFSLEEARVAREATSTRA